MSELLRGPVTVANLTAAAGVTTTVDGWWPCLDITWRTPVPASITKITAQVRERGTTSPIAETVLTAADLAAGTAKIVNGVSVGQHLEARLSPAGAPGLPFQATPWVEVTTSWDALIAALGGLNLGCGAVVCGDTIEWVQEKLATATYAVTLDSAPTENNWLVAFAEHNSATPTANTGWTSVATHAQTIQGSYVTVARKRAGAAESAAQTPFSGSAGSRGGVVVVELTGLLGGWDALFQAVTFAEAPATGNATAVVSDETTANDTFALAFSGWQDAATASFTFALDAAWQGPHASGPNTDQRAVIVGHRDIAGLGETVTATTTTGVAKYGLTTALLLITSPKWRRIGALSIRDEGTEVEDIPVAINFVGAALDVVSDAAGGVTVTLGTDTDGTLAANSDAKIATQKATKTYIDAKLAGLSWKQAVRVATTANGTLATAFENGDAIDGVTLATGDRILIKNQSSGAENGIYVVAASGAPSRATDADSGVELVNASVYVSEGTTQADTQWTCTTNAPITVGSTSLAFAQLTSGGGVSDGDKGDITVSGSGATFTIDPDVVTYAKMQNVSATSRVLGRKTSGAGDVEELTLSEVLDFIGSAAEGDLLYRSTSGWARLAAGTSGRYLKTQGAGASPVWDSPGSSGGGASLEGSIVKPTMSQFAWVNQGTATGTDGSKGIILDGPSNASLNLRILKKSAPGTPFDVVMRYDDMSISSASVGCFLIARNSTSGRLFLFGVDSPDNFTNRLISMRFASATSFTSATQTVYQRQPPKWLRFNVTSTTITAYVSPNGLDWFQIVAETIATYLTGSGGSLDEIGFGVRVDNQNTWMLVSSFDTALPT